MEHTVTVQEAAKLMNISRQAVLKKIQKGELLVKIENHSSGRKRYLVYIASFPAEIQQAYWKSRLPKINSMSTESEAGDHSSPSRDVQKRVSMPGIHYSLAELKHAVGEERFQFIMEEAEIILEAIEKAQNPPKRVKKEKWMAQVASEYGMSVPTLYRKIKEFKEYGVLGVARKSRLLTQGPRRTSISPEVEKVIRGTFLDRGQPSISDVERAVKQFCETNGYKTPSSSSVSRYIKDMETYEPDLCCLAREGEEAYMKKYAEKATRKEPDYVNQIWMGDHHKLDMFISYRGRPIRPWITVWFDICSRVVVGWCISTGANGRTIALALRHAMLPKKIVTQDEHGNDIEDVLEIGGIPAMLYIDNGEDYKAQVRAGTKHEDWEMSRETRSICAQWDIKVQFATPYHPQAKAHVERWFRTFTEQFTRRQPGWCGRNNKVRPEGFDEKEMHAKGELIDLEELSKRVEAYLYKYHTTEHSKIRTTPMQKHFSTPKIREGWPDERALDICLMDIEKATVSASGIQRFGSRGRPRWFWHEKMPAYVGQKVIIKYDPNRIGELLVFHSKTGKYLFTATNKELLAFDASKEDVQELHKRRSNRRKQVKQLIREAHADLEQVATERQAAGTQRKSGRNSSAKGNVQVLVGTEQVVKQIEEEKRHKERNTAGNTPHANKTLSAIDEYILREGTEG